MNRLLTVIDLFLDKKPGIKCFAQTGESEYMPKNMQSTHWLSAKEFEHHIKNSDLIISHAGMGNILLANEFQKPIILMARQAEFGEHINNHQKGTVEGFSNRPFIYVIESECDLEAAIQWAKNWQQSTIDNAPRENLLDTLNKYLLSC